MIKELHIYDFDATLFMSPMFPDDWEGHTGDWFDTVQSLTPPCVVDAGPLWIGSTVASAAESMANPEVYTVLMTGRGASAELKARVMELIGSVGLGFDEAHLKPGGGTLPWKSSMIEQLVKKLPDLETVQIWEDRGNHLSAFMALVDSLGLKGIPHPVNVTLNAPCVLDEPIAESILRQYLRSVL